MERFAQSKVVLGGICFVLVTVLSLHAGPSAARGAGQSATPQRNPPAAPFDRSLLDSYCVGCHNARTKMAGLALDQLDPTRVGDNAQVWEKVVVKLRGREMPPVGSRRPDEATYRSAVASLEATLDRAAAAQPNPGRVVVHRLNRTEYTNAVRDLLALAIDPQTMLGPDETGYGFDNIADVLTISPGLLERYKLAAWKISRLAIGDGSIRPSVDTYKVSRFLDQTDRVNEELPFGSRGGIVVQHTFPLDGEYSLRLSLQRAYAQNVIKGLTEREEIDVRLDGKRIRLFAIGGDCVGSEEPRCKEFRPQLNVASGVRVLPAEYDLYADKDLEVRFAAKAGPATITVAFADRSAAATEGGGAARQPLAASLGDTGVGLMSLDKVQIEGPFAANVPLDTPSRRQIFVCRPKKVEDEGPCAATIVSKLARRAYRRPVTSQEVEVLLNFFRAGRKDGGFERGIQLAIEALLMSPNFLLRVEQSPPMIAQQGTAFRVADIDLASRLSFFLWSSIPDEELIGQASAGKLGDDKVLEQQVRRMVADSKSSAWIQNFFAQWFSLRDLQNVAPDPATFPDFDDNLREAFLRETELFVDSQVRDDRPATELLTANYTFLNERLARFYGVPHIYGTRFRRVELTDPNRQGLLGHGSVLTVTSYSTRTSPVVRGKWLLSNILGSPPPAPPPNVPALVENGEGGAAPSSVRDRMERHRSNAVCASCHRRIDPMGFALENFSAIGRWRTTEYGLPIDATGAFPDGTRFSNPAEFRKILLTQREEFVKTLTTKLLTYAIGRGAEYYDMPAVRTIMRDATSSDYRWSALMLALVKSVPFRMSRTALQESPAGAVASVR